MSSSQSCSSQPNVGDVERAVSIVGGALLAANGLRAGSPRGLVFAMLGGAGIYRGLTGHCSLYKSLGINTASAGVQQGIKIEKTVVIDAPREKLFKFWRRLENLSIIMTHLVSVENLGHKRSRWTAKGPLDQNFSWEAEIINEKENELIAWQSVPGASIQNAGSVHFEEAGANKTTLSVNLQYSPPAGRLGAALAGLLGENPASQIMNDLLQFKKAMESEASVPAYAELAHL